MTESLPVTLGGLRLVGVEVPTFFDRVGRLRAAVHHTLGGDKVLQVLGTDPQRRQLSGYFIGPAAADSGELLEALRDAATPIMLTIGTWTEYVLIVSVAIRYAEQGSVIRYFIEAEALPSSSTNFLVTTQSIVSDILSDIAQSENVLGSIQDQSESEGVVQSGLALASQSIAVSSQGSGGLPADIATPGQNLQGLLTSVSSSISMLAVSAGPGNFVSDSEDLGLALRAAGVIALLVQAGGYVNRAYSSQLQMSGGTSLPLVHS